MGRNELEERSLQQQEELNIGGTKGRKGCRDRGEGKGKEDCAPPWTKYLLDEGLDHTKTFSRYRGVFAGEGTPLEALHAVRAILVCPSTTGKKISPTNSRRMLQ